MSRRFAAVLFDLDGTLIDSARDLAGAANEMRRARSLPPLPFEALRPMAGAGARGMIGVALGIAPGDAEYESLRDEFLDRYEQRMLAETRVFEAMESVIDRLDQTDWPWGIVTNKVERFTLPVVEGLRLHRRAAVVVSGDTTPHTKPHPEPLLEASRRLGVRPQGCVYVGDDLRDVQAGRAAGMVTAVARWGYLGTGDAVEAWGADVVIGTPSLLLNWLGLT
jgi:2-phosphoglycolate phosphatase